MKKKRFIARQGDILVIQLNEDIPDDARVIEQDQLTLALGEATGHSHTVTSKGAVLYAVKENLRLMKLERATSLLHQEHAEITLPAGNYQIIRQVEYTPRRIVNVAD